jgi:hypothetical protein
MDSQANSQSGKHIDNQSLSNLLHILIAALREDSDQTVCGWFVIMANQENGYFQ